MRRRSWRHGLQRTLFFIFGLALSGWLSRRGVSRLKCKNERVERLLQSRYTPLLRDFRDAVFHFDPEFRNAALQFAGEEDEVLIWLEDLSEALAAYFLHELGSDSLVASITTPE